MLIELNTKDSLFVLDSLKLTSEQKDVRRKELFSLYKEVQGFNQTARTALQKKQEELMQPVRKKAYDGISAVSKENKYTYVLDINSIIIAPPGDNILALVKKKLGIVTAAPKTK
jgi:outer membrane protein